MDHDLTWKERRNKDKIREIAAEKRKEGKEVKIGYNKLWIDGEEYGWRERTHELFRREKGPRRREGPKGQTRIKVISWNVAGIRSLEEETWGYIKGFDVICLQETWLEVKDTALWEKRLKGFEYKATGAQKGGARGRTKGGW